jgi:hypothetical protein
MFLQTSIMAAGSGSVASMASMGVCLTFDYRRTGGCRSSTRSTSAALRTADDPAVRPSENPSRRGVWRVAIAESGSTRPGQRILVHKHIVPTDISESGPILKQAVLVQLPVSQALEIFRCFPLIVTVSFNQQHWMMP